MLVPAPQSGDSVGTGAGAHGGSGREAQQGSVTQGGHVSLQPWLGVAPSDRSESSSRGARDDQRGDSRACPFWNEWHRRDSCAVSPPAPEPPRWDGTGSTHPSPERAPANFSLWLCFYQLTEAALP